MSLIFLLEETLNIFKYPFVTIAYFWFIVIIATVAHLIMSDRNIKINIAVKNSLTTNCNTMLDDTKKSFELN